MLKSSSSVFAFSSNTFQLRCFFIKFIYMLSLSHFKLAQNLPRRNWRKIKFDALTCVCNPNETCAYCENMHKFKRKCRRHSSHGIESFIIIIGSNLDFFNDWIFLASMSLTKECTNDPINTQVKSMLCRIMSCL